MASFIPLDPISQMIDEIRATLNGIKAQTDKFTFDANSYLYVNAAIVANPPNLDIALSTLDADLKSNLPRKLVLDDGTGTYGEIHRSGNALLISINEDKVGLLKTADLSFDASGYLNVNAQVVANPPNLDVALSTRASESTLSDLNSKFPAASSLADGMANPTTTIIGSALLGFNGTNWDRVLTTGGRLIVDKIHLLQFDAENRPYVRAEPHRIYPSDTATGDGTSTSFTLNLTLEKGVRKTLHLINGFSVDATVDIEGSVDGTDYFTIVSGITIPAGESRWGVLDSAIQSVRVSVTTTTAPASGETFTVKAFGVG